MTIVRFESENYYFQFYNLQLKEPYSSPEKIVKVVSDLEKLSGFLITKIYCKDKNGRPTYHFQRDVQSFPNDHDWMCLERYAFNGCYFEQIVHCEEHRISTKEVKQTISEYFLDRSKTPISQFSYIGGIAGNDTRISKFKKFRSAQHRSKIYHQISELSPIETIFEKVLLEMKLPFKKQQEVFQDGALLSVVDFLIEKPLIAIYCDGFHFHSKKDSIQKDRSQDRALQLLGYRVLRFTGSEISEDPHSCVKEVLRFMEEKKI